MRLRAFFVATISMLLMVPSSRALAQAGLAADTELVETRMEVPKLKAPAEYAFKDGVVDIELSEYAGYAGLIAANGGLEPSEDSVFFKKGNFKVRIRLSEEESWSALNSGRIAASATTADVLAVYGRQFEAAVPLLIGFSRGADGIVVRSDIKRFNDLKGKVLSACQFTESDFLLRYLAQESGLGITMLPNLSARPDPDKVNVVYCGDAFGAGDLFLRDLKASRTRLAGCVTWEPKTGEVVKGADSKARLLISNRNLLVIADVLVVNKAFNKNHPDIVKVLVAGWLEGNDKVRADADKHLDAVAKAFKWDRDKAKAELAKVHLANLPENLAFFNGTIDSAGSYGYIYETAAYVYGEGLLGKPPAPAERFPDLAALKAIDKDGTFKNQKAAIEPIRVAGAAKVERNLLEELPVLSKDIRFFFQPNSSKLDSAAKENAPGLDAIAQILKVSPGSMVLLRGHADGSRIEEIRKSGGEGKARETRLALKNLSKARCEEIKTILADKFKMDAARIEFQGVGADEPTGKGPDADRRVEVQWFTVE
jgi:NitT/TauT family transport system substrate-binding protein